MKFEKIWEKNYFFYKNPLQKIFFFNFLKYFFLKDLLNEMKCKRLFQISNLLKQILPLTWWHCLLLSFSLSHNLCTCIFFYLKSHQAKTNFIFAIYKLTIMTQGYVHFLLMKNTKNYGKKVMTEPWYRIWWNEQALWPMCTRTIFSHSRSEQLW